MTLDHYILHGRTPLLVDLQTWADFFEDINKRRIAHNHVGDACVGTVFLGLNHNFSKRGDPVLFESMVFGGALHHEMRRYRTYRQAVLGHREMLRGVRKAQQRISELKEMAGVKTE